MAGNTRWLRTTLGLMAGLGVALAAPVAQANQCTGSLPVMLIVQDRSGSMQDPPDLSCTRNCTSKWDIAAQSVPALVNNFSSNFQFALDMFPNPADPTFDGCSTGVVYEAPGATYAHVTQDFQSYATDDYSATPTGETLAAVKPYLDNLHLGSTQAYVLLITDGIPTCGTGGYNTAAAYAIAKAGALNTAGYKVYVVGFGSVSTSANDKATLDAMAAQGGTVHSYSATDAASLNAALQQIAGQVVCCVDNCANGATQCAANGQIQACALQQNGCYDWVSGNCPPGDVCSSGQCQASCQSHCNNGDIQCNGAQIQVCTQQASGCYDWMTGNCPPGNTCSSGQCVPACTDACTVGATQCVGTVAQQCNVGSTGCTEWTTLGDCGALGCGNGTCCECTTGAAQCTSTGELQTCSLSTTSQAVCPSWHTSTCPNGTCLSGACFTSCTPGAEISSCPSGSQCVAINGGTYCAVDTTNGGYQPPPSTGGTSAGTDSSNGGTDGTSGTDSTTGDSSSAGTSAASGGTTTAGTGSPTGTAAGNGTGANGTGGTTGAATAGTSAGTTATSSTSATTAAGGTHGAAGSTGAAGSSGAAGTNGSGGTNGAAGGNGANGAGGVNGASGSTGTTVTTAGGPANGAIAASGCGCNAADGSGLGLLFVGLLARRRQRA